MAHCDARKRARLGPVTLGSSDQAQCVTSSAASSHVPYRSLKAGCRLAAREQEQKPQQLALDEGRDQARGTPYPSLREKVGFIENTAMRHRGGG